MFKQPSLIEAPCFDRLPADGSSDIRGSRYYHYEMSSYITARNLAQQLHLAPVVHLLQTSLGEEENADQLLNQIARPLMSVVKMPENVEVE